MKYVLFDEVYNTKSLSAQGMSFMMQNRLDDWLGKGTVKVEVSLPAEKEMSVKLWRKYGTWYEDPKRFSNCNDSIYSFDEHIFLGTDYQTGTYADLTQHIGRYLIYDDVQSIFLPDMKEMAKRHHGSRIKSVSVDNNLDFIELGIELV